jgi:hypothetical protein
MPPAVCAPKVIGSWRWQNGQIMPHFLLVCGESIQPVGVVVMEAPSMLQAHTSAVAGDLAGGLAFGEVHELSTKMAATISSLIVAKTSTCAEYSVHDRESLYSSFSTVVWMVSAQYGQKVRLSRGGSKRGVGCSSVLAGIYTFTSPFSLSSAAENGPFFFWLLWVLPS